MALPHIFATQTSPCNADKLDENFDYLDGLGINGAIHSAESAAGVTPTDYRYPPLDIRRYGAVGDDSTVCNTALSDAIKVAALTDESGTGINFLHAASVYIPPGVFLVTANNPFGGVDFTSLTGGYTSRFHLGFVGDGMSSQIHWKPTGSSAAWLYDSTSLDNVLALPLFKDFMVHADVTGLSGGGTINGFHLVGTSTANGVVQGFKFHGCKFIGVDDIYTTADGTNRSKTGTFLKYTGTVNASETVMTGCSVRGFLKGIHIGPNAESLNHTFLGTDFEEIYGDVITIEGGSSLNMYGGSFRMRSDSTAYFVNMTSTTAGYFGTFTFLSLRVEFLANVPASGYFSNLFELDTTALGDPPSYKAVVNFTNCNFYPIGGSARNTISVDAATNMTVNFLGCAMGPALHKLVAVNTLSGLQNNFTGPFTSVNFVDGEAVLPSDVTFDSSTSAARISARNCNNTLDYDRTVLGAASAKAGSRLPLKTVSIYGGAWPDTGNNATMQVVLPLNSIIKAARFYKAANGGTATAGYQLAIQDGDSTALCSSTIANQNVVHSATADEIYSIATTTNKRTINLVATAGHLGSAQAIAMALGDYAMVDYW